MSIITPLLDTLLHDVLGKRMDRPARRELTEPVRPVLPTEAAQAIRSDSRLDARRPPFPELTSASVREESGLERDKIIDRSSGTDPGSSQTRLSPTAEVIRALVARHPAPASVFRSPAPLVAPPSTGQTAQAEPARQLAESLRTSIRESGLFYESHLKAWYRGRLPAEALDREPQMRLQPKSPPSQHLASPIRGTEQAGTPAPLTARSTPSVIPAAPNGSVDPRGEGSLDLASEPLLFNQARPVRASTESVPVGEASAAATAKPGDPSASSSPPVAPSRTGALQEQALRGGEAGLERDANLPRAALESSEALQNIVRHQLELLTVPVLRWEGEVWQGLFMNLMIHSVLPPVAERPAGDEEGRDEGEEDSQEWHSELSLELSALGAVRVSLRLRQQQLDITLRTESARALEQLSAARDALFDRLAAQGFAAPRLQVQLQAGGGESGDRR